MWALKPAMVDMKYDEPNTLQEAFVTKVKETMKAIAEICSSDTTTTCDSGKVVVIGELQKSAVDFIQKMSTALPSCALECKETLEQLDTITARSMETHLVVRLGVAVTSLAELDGPAPLVTAEKCQELKTVLAEILATVVEPKQKLQEHSENMAKTADNIVDGCSTSCETLDLKIDVVKQMCHWMQETEAQKAVHAKVSQLDAAHALCVQRKEWQQGGETDEARIESDGSSAGLAKWLAAQARTKDLMATEGVKIHPVLQSESEASAKALAAVQDIVVTKKMQEADEFLKGCTAHLEKAQWPADGEVTSASYDEFLKFANESFLTYVGGDECRKAALLLKDAEEAWRKVSEQFQCEVQEEKQKAYNECVAKVDALVFTVKAIKGAEKHKGEDTKLKRFMRTNSKKAKADPPDLWQQYIPAALLSKMDEF